MEAMVWYQPTDPAFTYEGRIDFEKAQAPVFVYAGSFVRFCMKGQEGAIAVRNRHSYFENALGVLVDGLYRGKILLHDGEKTCGEIFDKYLLRLDKVEAENIKVEGEDLDEEVRFFDLSPFLDGEAHEITVFKRMDTCHYFSFLGLVAPLGACTNAVAPLPKRRIEVFGDSVSCGEVSEAIGRCGMDDPEGHNGIYSNSFYSYSWILARRLDARVHITSQGGIALLDGEGYFNEPDRMGMISSYDKIQINPSLGERKQWDFTNYIPHVVIVAIGQNDAHPENYMAEDYDGEKAVNWRRQYRVFLGKLREHYPNAEIILTTTILGHSVEWDQAIEQVCRECGDERVHHFLYSKNGCGTSGHIRRTEAQQMAEEMEAFLNSLGEGIWLDQ